MTSIALCYALMMPLALSGSASDVQKSAVLTVEAREILHALAEERLDVMDIFLPEQPDAVKVPLSSVPERVKIEAAAWIRRVVQERWLPADFESKLTALKDVKQWERKNKEGTVVYERIGDFLALDHEVSDYVIHVQDSGGSISVRVDFSEVVAVADDPGGFIKECLKEFLNIPDGVVGQFKGEIKQDGPVYWVFLRLAEMLDNDPNHRRRWWDHLSVCTDGHFFFVRAPEIGEGRYNPRAKPGLPNRF